MRRALASAVMLFVMASCVSALGIDEERQSAVTALCQCVSGPSKAFEDFDDCARAFNSDLDSASAGTRAAWLQNFSENSCHECKTPVDYVKECLRIEPTCRQSIETCNPGKSLPCCPGLSCSGGQCQ